MSMSKSLKGLNMSNPGRSPGKRRLQAQPWKGLNNHSKYFSSNSNIIFNQQSFKFVIERFLLMMFF